LTKLTPNPALIGSTCSPSGCAPRPSRGGSKRHPCFAYFFTRQIACRDQVCVFMGALRIQQSLPRDIQHRGRDSLVQLNSAKTGIDDSANVTDLWTKVGHDKLLLSLRGNGQIRSVNLPLSVIAKIWDGSRLCEGLQDMHTLPALMSSIVRRPTSRPCWSPGTSSLPWSSSKKNSDDPSRARVDGSVASVPFRFEREGETDVHGASCRSFGLKHVASIVLASLWHRSEDSISNSVNT